MSDTHPNDTDPHDHHPHDHHQPVHSDGPTGSGGLPDPVLDTGAVRELAEIPAVEVITRAAVMLMSAAAEKLGLADDGDRYRDLDEARRLISALAGLMRESAEYLGVHRRPLQDGLRGLQAAFREYSVIPDEPGEGPGEKHA